MSSVSAAVKSAEELIESISSSTERSNLTTTFTNDTIVEKSSGFFTKFLDIISHPKFKWILLAIILTIIAFLYFKSQNKQIEKHSPNDATYNVVQDENGKPLLVEVSDMPNVERMKQQTDQQTRQQIRQQIRQEMEQQMRQQMEQQVNQQKKQNKKSISPISEESVDSSDEVFIEDENIMKHNLTAEEMNAIDRQLEDVNIDHLINHTSE
jgi:type III secretory pathway component EscV